jgi:DNA-binding response OmpR family regulator
MSGFSDAVQGRTAAHLGVDALLTKPFTPQELGKAMRKVLENEKPRLCETHAIPNELENG